MLITSSQNFYADTKLTDQDIKTVQKCGMLYTIFGLARAAFAPSGFVAISDIIVFPHAEVSQDVI
jgi:hypothetical protein